MPFLTLMHLFSAIHASVMSIALDQGQMDKALAAAAVKDDAERVEMWISRGACKCVIR